MKRIVATSTILAALAVPGAASAKVVELGSTVPRTQVSCPTDCQAITRVTGYQGRGGSVSNPFQVPRAGKLVAFTVRLGAPTADQERFFRVDLRLGDPEVRLSVLRRGGTRRTRKNHRLLAQSASYDIRQYFGSAPTFVLDRPIRVRRNNIVALTTPTWVPALAVGVGRDHWWRTSRSGRPNCMRVTERAALTRLNSVTAFGCTYSTARMYYTATYIPDPRPVRRTRR